MTRDLNTHIDRLKQQEETLAAEHRHQAVRKVCEDATDAADAAHLLEALGLDPTEGIRDSR
jgi:hypothetical protein